jgi:hypothetical protein
MSCTWSNTMLVVRTRERFTLARITVVDVVTTGCLTRFHTLSFSARDIYQFFGTETTPITYLITLIIFILSFEADGLAKQHFPG